MTKLALARALVLTAGALSACQRPAAQSPPAEKGAPAQDVRLAAYEDGESRRVDPDADRLLRRMSDYLGSLPAFAVTTDHTTEVVLDSGQKVQLVGSSDVMLRRPDKLRTDRRGQIAEAAFYYDGKTVTVYGKRLNLYAQASAPPTIDRALDAARERFDLDPPGVDFLYANPYDALTEDVVSGNVVGRSTIAGVPCDHLALRGRDVDLQIWIEQGDKPLPRRYVITTKDDASQPEFTVTMHDWHTAPFLTDDLFAFTPPTGAQRVEFLGELRRRAGARRGTRSNQKGSEQ